jgi:hypothetical protein
VIQLNVVANETISDYAIYEIYNQTTGPNVTPKLKINTNNDIVIIFLFEFDIGENISR